MNNFTENDIRAKLAALDHSAPAEPEPANYFNRPRRRAGVLIPFTRIDGAWHLLFIRRSEFEDDHHGGQVAFPGGGEESGDTDIIATALRETHEEIGLAPDHIRILGSLSEVISITNYAVTPVVGVFDSPYNFAPDKAEVARIFTLPLAWLADAANVRTETHTAPGGGSWPVITYNQMDGELLWGFTAGLTRRLLTALH